MFTVSKEKKLQVSRFEKKKFWTGLCGSALISLLRKKKIWTPFLFSQCHLTEKKLRLILKSVARFFHNYFTSHAFAFDRTFFLLFYCFKSVEFQELSVGVH